MSTAVTKPLGAMERVLIGGDLSRLNEQERLDYYKATCESLGLNPLTKPFDYISLNGKLQLYAKRDCTDQLRKIHNVSVKIVSREVVEGVFAVTAQARMPDGREDESVGAVPIVREANGEAIPLKPEDRANAMMKAETKSKRRVTLSICGLGMLDESEFDTMGTVPRTHRAPQEQQAQLPEPSYLPPELEDLFGPEAPKKGTATAFEMSKRELIEAMGEEKGDEEYHRLLDHNGIVKGAGKLDIHKVRTCISQMWTTAQAHKNLKAKMAGRPLVDPATEDSVF